MSGNIIGLIPARSGSQRVPGKNIRPLGGHPLLAHTVSAALRSEIFSHLFICSDSEEYIHIASLYGAESLGMRPTDISGGNSPDIDWVKWADSRLNRLGIIYDALAILRPTSPFRRPESLVNAWKTFYEKGTRVDSLRAISKCTEHPGKMWTLGKSTMSPLLPFSINDVPWHSNQYPSLPTVYVQNASLEILWKDTLRHKESISGDNIMPYISNEYEGYDINSELDFLIAEILIRERIVNVNETRRVC